MSDPKHQRASIFERSFLPAADEGRRRHWFQLMFRHDTPAERNFDLWLIVIILVSVGVVMLDSVDSIKTRWHEALVLAEWLFTLTFTVEYAVRLWVVRRPWRYATSFYGIVDLLAVLPTYLALILTGSSYLIVIRILRLLRVFRVLKLVEYSSEAGELITALMRSRRKIFVFVSALLGIVVVFGALMYVVEGPEHGFTSIPAGMYWAIVTMATVGYGDIVPYTVLGRFVTSTLILIGYSIIAVPTGIYTAELASSLIPKRRKVRCPECGLRQHEADADYCRLCGSRLPTE